MTVVEDHPYGVPSPLSAAELRAISEALSSEFLAAHQAEEERIEFETVALDPYRLRVRWRVPAAALKKARAALGAGARSAPLTLRFHSLDPILEASPYDVFLDDGAGERAFAFRRSGAAYRVEFGLLRPDGALEPLAPDAVATTPPSAPAPAVDLTLRDIRFPSTAALRFRPHEWNLPAADATGGAVAAELAAVLQSGSPAAALLLRTGSSGAPADPAPPRGAIAWP